MASWEAWPRTIPVPQGQTPRGLAEDARLPAGIPNIVDSPLASTGSQCMDEGEYVHELTESGIVEAEAALESFKGV